MRAGLAARQLFCGQVSNDPSLPHSVLGRDDFTRLYVRGFAIVGTFLRGEGSEGFANGFAEVFVGACVCFLSKFLSLEKTCSIGFMSGEVFQREEQLGTRLPDRAADGLTRMAAEIIPTGVLNQNRTDFEILVFTEQAG